MTKTAAAAESMAVKMGPSIAVVAATSLPRLALGVPAETAAVMSRPRKAIPRKSIAVAPSGPATSPAESALAGEFPLTTKSAVFAAAEAVPTSFEAAKSFPTGPRAAAFAMTPFAALSFCRAATRVAPIGHFAPRTTGFHRPTRSAFRTFPQAFASLRKLLAIKAIPSTAIRARSIFVALILRDFVSAF